MGLRLGVLAPAVLLLAGCGSVSPGAGTAEQTALAARDVADSAGAQRACESLAPDVITSLREESGLACPAALQSEPPPTPGKVVAARVYGQAAQVVFDNDVAFLTVIQGKWRVTAMDCAAVAGHPYDCSIGGR